MVKLFKKPWDRDLKKENKPVVDVRDSYSAISNSRESTTYEYYEDNDPRISVDLGNDRFSLWDDSSTNDRNSTLLAFKQASCYFDSKLSSKEKKMKNQKETKSELRLSTGIVNHEISKDEDGKISFRVPKRRLNQPKSSPKPRLSTMPPSLETMQEGEEGDEDSSSNEDDEVRRSDSAPRRRSISPAAGNRQTERPGMTRSNSWTSTRELNSKKKKKLSSTKDIGSKKKKKKKDGNSSSDTTKKKRGDKEKNSPPTRTNSDPLSKEKESAYVGLSSARGKSSLGIGRSGARSPKRSGKSKRFRNRSSSPEKKKESGGSKRPGLLRRNSWTSNSNLNANSGKTAELIARNTPQPLSLIDEGSNKKAGSKKKISSKKKLGEKGKSGRSQSPKQRSSGPEKKCVGKKLMAGLRKSRAIAQSISIVSTKDNVDSAEMKMLQNQLREAMEETMRLKDEHDKDKQSLGTAMTETDELQQMLAESAKENMELLTRLEAQADSVRENNAKLETMAKELEQLREEKANKDAMLTKLQQELVEEKSGVEKGQDTVTSLRSELETTKDKLNAALAELESSKEKVEDLDNRLQDAETVERGLQSAIDKWTDKAFLWQEKAERLELEVAKNFS